MSYLMVHLNVGYRLIEECPDIEDVGTFLLGTVVPDAIMFKPGCLRSDKSKTHFCVGDEGWGCYTNYDAWLESVTDNIHLLSEVVDKDFLFGYMAHVITDIEQTRCFWTPARLSDDEEYMRRYTKDCFEVDSLLLSATADIDALWGMLEKSNRHCIPELFTVDDNANLIEKMKSELYHNRYPDLDYTPTIYTMTKLSQFICNVADKAVKHRL